MKTLIKKSTILFLLALSLSFSSVSATAPLSGMCIALVHGILGFDDTNGLADGLVKYWGGLDTYLRGQGALVLTPGSAPMNTIPVRASQIQSAVTTWMASNGCTKVHLVGHSQGAVVRYMVSNLGFASKAASVNMVDGVNHGAPMADVVLAAIPSWMQPFVNTVMSLIAQLVYQNGFTNNAIAMTQSLTVPTVKSFNASTPDVSGMRYYSYGNSMAFADPIEHPIMALTYPITWAGGIYYGQGTANDGVVPLSSQQYGTWKGSPSSYWFATGIDHLQATNFEYSGQTYFDVQGWYLTIAKNVK